MCSPAASLESVGRSGPIYICHSMLRGKWIDNQECLYLPCSLSNPPSFTPAVTCWVGLCRQAVHDQKGQMASGMRRMKRGKRNVKEIQKGTQQNCSLAREDSYSFCFAISSLFHSLDNRLLTPPNLVCCCHQDGDSSAIRKSAKRPLRSLFLIWSLFLAASHLTWVVIAPTTAVLLVEQTPPVGLVPPEMV